MRVFRSLVLAAACAFAPTAQGQIAPLTPAPAQEPAPAVAPVAVQTPRLLHFVQADYPPDALTQGLDGSVLLALTLDTSGRVTDARVLTAIGHGFDEAALAAARGFVFAPATRNGVPVEAVLRYRYRFNATVARAGARSDVRAVLRGVVRGSGEHPLVGARVRAVTPAGPPREAVTDSAGVFRFDFTIAGPVTVTVTADGYAPGHDTETLGDRDDVSVTYRLVRVTTVAAHGATAGAQAVSPGRSEDVAGEAVVRAQRPAREVTRRELDFEEILRMPGTGGDALRAVQNLPGVGRSITGLLIVRGSTPNDTQIFADGTNLPLVYHFFGLSSVISTELLDRIDFYPGNFSARYGRAEGGVVDLGLRNPRSEGVHAVANINLMDASVFAEGAITHDLSVAFAFRRSYIDAVLGAVLSGTDVNLLTAPRYYDYQALVDYHPSRRDHLRLAFLGSDDQFALVNNRPNDSAPRFTGEFSTAEGFNTGQILWDHTFSSTVTSHAVASLGRNTISLGAGSVFALDLAFWQYNVRYEVQWQVSRILRANFGIDLTGGPATVTFTGGRMPTMAQQQTLPTNTQSAASFSTNLFRPAAYAELEIAPVTGLRFIPGLRVDYAGDANHTATVSPRMALRWEFLHDWIFKGGLGIYTQPPQPQESSGAPNLYNPALTVGNPFLGFERAVQYSLGLEHSFTDYLNASVEGFYKTLDDQVVPGISPLAEPYNNGGTGRIYGAEVLVRHRLSRRFYGWIAYTLSRSERRDPGETGYHLFQFDQTHILTAIASYRLGRGWELGARFRYVTGNPVTPVIGAYLDGNLGTYVPIYGPTLSTRVDPFHQLDVRVDKTWTFTRWNLDLYLEVLNVYNRTNPEAVQYSYNYTQSSVVGGIPFFPNLGIRGEFQ